MKKGQVILSASALIVSLVAGFAVKAHSKLRNPLGTIFTKTGSTCTIHRTCKETATSGGTCAQAAPYYLNATDCANDVPLTSEQFVKTVQ